jgi:hypothetical protein
MKFVTEKWLRTCVACAGAAIFAVLTAPSALAVDDIGLFELEGDALDSNGYTTLPDDWETLYDNGGSATATTDPKDEGGNVVIEDPAPVSIFTTGGSKDPLPIGSWKHKDGSVPDKDDITNAYAANYEASNGDQVIYFGADRYANDGDALLGFWFFQKKVEALPDGSFSGEHVNGDVFVIASFTGGGQDATVEILEWDDSCVKANKDTGVGGCPAANLKIRVPAGTATCTPSGPTQNVCAITNTGGQESPWPYTPKSGTAGEFPVASFFEGGFNVSQIFGSQRCFASFLAETRSSSSETAVLKDFVLGAFDVCSVDATKTCVNDTQTDDDNTIPELNYNIRGCAINTGAAPISVTGLSNVVAGGDSVLPSVTWYVPPEGFDPAEDCDDSAALFDVTEYTGTPTTYMIVDPGEALVYSFTETTDLNGPSDMVTISAADPEGTSEIDPASDGADCPQALFPAGISVTKACAADLEDAGDNLVVVINIEGQVCNEGDVELTGLQLVDETASGPVILNPDSTTLAPKGDEGACTGYTGYYYPADIPTGDVCPFADMVTASAIADPNYADPTSVGCAIVGTDVVCSILSNSPTCELRVTDGDSDCATGPWDPPQTQ